MGTWGPGIFSNDTAWDVRVAYRMALEDGLDDQAAQQQVLDQFADGLGDDTWNDGPLVWLALAKTQWQLGRLDNHVKAQALAVIDQGRDLASWEDSDLYGYRRAVLGRLRHQLTTAPPPRKPTRPPRHVDPEAVRRRLPYQEGSVLQLPLRDGRSARGLVSRLDPSSGLIVAYFFGPPWSSPGPSGRPARRYSCHPALSTLPAALTTTCAGVAGRCSGGAACRLGPGHSRRTTSPRAWPPSSVRTIRYRGSPRRCCPGG